MLLTLKSISEKIGMRAQFKKDRLIYYINNDFQNTETFIGYVKLES
jgi:hypothetical protein